MTGIKWWRPDKSRKRCSLMPRTLFFTAITSGLCSWSLEEFGNIWDFKMATGDVHITNRLTRFEKSDPMIYFSQYMTTWKVILSKTDKKCRGFYRTKCHNQIDTCKHNSARSNPALCFLIHLSFSAFLAWSSKKWKGVILAVDIGLMNENNTLYLENNMKMIEKLLWINLYALFTTSLRKWKTLAIFQYFSSSNFNAFFLKLLVLHSKIRKWIARWVFKLQGWMWV